MGNSERDIKKTCPNADVKAGLAITGSSVGHADHAIEQWLAKNGLR